MYGGEGQVTLNEESLFNPKVLVASKVFAHHITNIHRDSYDLFAVNGIFLIMNHHIRRNVCNKKDYKSSWSYCIRYAIKVNFRKFRCL